ncbi:MAG: hypothetical protein ACTHN5_06100 [Phycisphaerae bacterium]
MKRGCLLPLAFVGMVLPVGIAGGAVTGATGAVVLNTSPPASIISGDWESNTAIREFVEAEPKTLTQAVAVDLTAPGTSPGAADDNLSPGTIPVGTVVNSYFLHFDPVGKPSTPVTLSGSITFDTPVLGLIALSSTLNGSIGSLGLASTTYASGSDHGMEFAPNADGTNDVLTLSADRRTVSFTVTANLNGDELRIVTGVPEAGSLGVVVGGGILLAARRRRRGACIAHK